MQDFICFVRGREYTPEELIHHEGRAYCPSQKAMRDYAERHSDFFIYDEPLLLSRDRKIMYGFSAEELSELVIPDEVEIYDNVCTHSDEEGCKFWVEIGAGLRKIVNKYEAFGYLAQGFDVKEENSCFSSIDGMLYDKKGETLIAFPPGRTTEFEEVEPDLERVFVQLPMCTKVIEEAAFQMLLLPELLVIPDSVQRIEDGAFDECFDKGLYMPKHCILERSIVIPERFRSVIDAIWREDAYERPRIKFY